ncbi:hypothetical protein CTZ27_35365 [Streptomyces griseocarneus]|nr:hypothetical protein CTZ27_35365 [Streptomyces griseocarneus]
MARKLMLGQLRVQQVYHRDGRVSYTIVQPGGVVHQPANGYLMKFEGQGTARTYAYYLADHLRWLENEALALEKVQFHDLERCMGTVGARVSMPFGAPWRIDKRP